MKPTQALTTFCAVLELKIPAAAAQPADPHQAKLEQAFRSRRDTEDRANAPGTESGLLRLTF